MVVICIAGTATKLILVSHISTVPDSSISVATTVPDPPLAGTRYTLRCVVSKTINGLTNTPTAAWEFDGGTEITTGGNIVVTTPSAGVAELTFSDITTSQAGTYICRARLTSPALNVDQEVTESVDINVLGECNSLYTNVIRVYCVYL